MNDRKEIGSDIDITFTADDETGVKRKAGRVHTAPTPVVPVDVNNILKQGGQNGVDLVSTEIYARIAGVGQQNDKVASSEKAALDSKEAAEKLEARVGAFFTRYSVPKTIRQQVGDLYRAREDRVEFYRLVRTIFEGDSELFALWLGSELFALPVAICPDKNKTLGWFVEDPEKNLKNPLEKNPSLKIKMKRGGQQTTAELIDIFLGF